MEPLVEKVDKAKNGSLLADLIHDLFCANPADMRLPKLAEHVAFVKGNKNWGLDKVDPVFEEIFKEEIEAAEAEGAKNNLLSNIRAVMKNLNFTATQAMDALGVPADKQKEYADLI